jgi:hypothetical protein
MIKIRNVFPPDNLRVPPVVRLVGACALLALSGCVDDHRVPDTGPPRPEAPPVVTVDPPSGVSVRLRSLLLLEHALQYRVDPAADTLIHARSGIRRVTLRRFYLQRIPADVRSGDTLDVIIEHLVQQATGSATTGRWAVGQRGRVRATGGAVPEADPEGAWRSPQETSVRTSAVENGRRLIAMRTTAAAGKPGDERFAVCGYTSDGSVRAYAGPVEFLRDGDLPGSLRSGQVFYVTIRRGCIRLPVPLTFEPRSARFVAEVGDDGLLPAQGTGTFTGGESGDAQIRLFQSYKPGASTLQASIALPSEVTIRRAYVPWLAFPEGSPRYSRREWVQVGVGMLEGWVPDSLYRHTGLLGCP